jgi:hypothetical protein
MSTRAALLAGSRWQKPLQSTEQLRGLVKYVGSAGTLYSHEDVPGVIREKQRVERH